MGEGDGGSVGSGRVDERRLKRGQVYLEPEWNLFCIYPKYDCKLFARSISSLFFSFTSQVQSLSPT